MTDLKDCDDCDDLDQAYKDGYQDGYDEAVSEMATCLPVCRTCEFASWDNPADDLPESMPMRWHCKENLAYIVRDHFSCSDHKRIKDDNDRQ